MDIITTDKAPAAIGPYSQALKIGNLVFCSGQIPLIPGTKDLAGPDIESQTRQVFENIRGVLAAAGLVMAHVVKTTVFLQSMDDFPAMNVIYAESFGAHKPARSTVEVAKLPLGARIEIECIAMSE